MVESKSKNSEGHRQRLREKFLASGLSGFHDYEIIELLLTIGTPRKDCKEAAKASLEKFKTIQNVLEASSSDLMDVKGIGPKNIFGIKLIKAVADRYLEKRLIHKEAIKNSRELLDYLRSNIRNKKRECFKVIYLNAKNKVISSETLFEGTLTSSSIYPREVIKAAIKNNAAALIFAHNHPSGDPDPSPEDFSITRKLYFALRFVDVMVHEHLILGENAYFSFADNGIIEKYKHEYENR